MMENGMMPSTYKSPYQNLWMQQMFSRMAVSNSTHLTPHENPLETTLNTVP
jgi:hypothetical protein